MSDQGIFIVIEGTDGSGKETQFRLLKERLTAVGHDVEVFDFPRYDRDSSHFVKQYLNGAYGPAKDISPYTASLFYALDRFEAAPDIKKALAAGKIVLCNRYVGSNMAHQGGKFNDAVEQRSFFVWEDSLEFQLLGIPRPQLNLVLKVPAETAQKLIAKKKARSYTDKSHDEHEADIEHLKKSVATYELLCQLFPNDFKLIDCTKNGELLSIPDINNLIWDVVKPLLPTQPSKPAHSVVFSLRQATAPGVKTTQKTSAGGATIKLDEKISLLAAYEASLNGLPVKINHDWSKNSYEYYRPEDLPKKTLAKYNEFLDHLVKLNKTIKSKLKNRSDAQAILAAATPLAALSQLQASLNPEELTPFVHRLIANNSPEVVGLASKLNRPGKNKSNGQIVRSKSQGPEPINRIIARLAAEHLPQNLAEQTEPVQLMEAWPRNEFKILVDTVYPYSNLTRAEIENQLDAWSYQQKSDALEAAISAKNSDLLDKFSYHFDIIADRLLLAQIIDSGLVSELKVQPATPRYGYEVPEGVDEAGVSDEFLECFDKSLGLFSTLQAAGREDLAPYATLLGHKSRLQLTCSLKSVGDCLKADNSAAMTRLLNVILEQIGEHHPIAMGGMVKTQVVASQPKAETKKPLAKNDSEAKSSGKSRSRRHHRGGKSQKS